jgi:hypothetical protein
MDAVTSGLLGQTRKALPLSAEVPGHSEPAAAAAGVTGRDDLPAGVDGDPVGGVAPRGEVRPHLAVAAEGGVKSPVRVVAGEGELGVDDVFALRELRGPL